MAKRTGPTPKQAAFCREYIKDHNGTQAAIRAKYSKNRSAEIAYQLLQKTPVKTEIKRLDKILESNALSTRERIEKELVILAFADMKDYVEVVEGGIVHIKSWSELPEGATRAVKIVKERKSIRASGEGDGEGIVIDNQVEFGHHDKLGALKELAKLKGLYPEEGTGEGVKLEFHYGEGK